MSAPPQARAFDEVDALDLWVFRDAIASVRGAELVRGLRDAIAAARWTEALVRAGEIECVLADGRHEAARGAGDAAELTGALAAAALGGAFDPGIARRALAAIALPEQVRLSPPESFSYYGLHPLDFADLAAAQTLRPRVGVVGLRSIGTTLSAVVCAALARRGVDAERITVRPRGEAFDKRLALGDAERAWVARQIARGAEIVVVDEGPGMSGSSFLAAGEALVEAGVPAADVRFFCSRAVDPARLCARDAATRWSAFRAAVVTSFRRVPAGARRIDDWRRLFVKGDAWPPSWRTMERFKLLSACGAWLLKFDGIGRHGAEALDRARALAEARLSPAVRDAGDGLVAHAIVRGRPCTARDLSPLLLDRLADACAIRAELPAPHADPRELAEALAFDAERLGEPPPPPLPIERPVICDARLAPHEWVLEGGDGTPWKVDATSHGDDHRFPGPTDIAWDVAGAIVEWRLHGAARERFLRRYRARSGDDVAPRLDAWIRAYTVYHHAEARMASRAMRGTDDEERLARAADAYAADAPPRDACA